MNFKLVIFKILCFFTFVLLVTKVKAQQLDINFDHITVEKGLSQSRVLAILQDQQGFIWFGTQNGLNKYDGYKFTVYKHDPTQTNSISNNWITGLGQDSQGVIWISTLGGGINKFDPKTNTFNSYKNDPKNPNSLSNNLVYYLRVDSKDNVWAATSIDGLNKLDIKTNKITRYHHDKNNPNTLSSDSVMSIFEDKEGTLWVGTTQGLNKFNPKNETFTTYLPKTDLAKDFGYITSMAQDSSGTIWLGTSNGGLNKFDPSTDVFTPYRKDPSNPNSISSNWVTAITASDDGGLWVGTYNGGLNRFNIATGNFTAYQSDFNIPTNIASNSINSLYKDRTGILWIGTYDKGISKYDPNSPAFKSFPKNLTSLNSRNIWAIFQDRSQIMWLGTAEGGFYKYDPKTNIFTNYSSKLSVGDNSTTYAIKTIYQDRSGVIWLAPRFNGLNRYNVETDSFTQFLPQTNGSSVNNDVLAIYEDSKERFWVGAVSGLYLFDRKTNQFTAYRNDPGNPNSLSSNSIWAITESSDGLIWLGTDAGINCFNYDKKIFTRFQHDPNNSYSLSYNKVVAIHQDKAGTIWIGTSGGGLNKFDAKNQNFIAYTEKDGLPDNTVNSILEDEEGNLWLGTFKGISKFNPKNNSFRNYDMNDGMQSNEYSFAACKTLSGELFFASSNGATYFYPDKIKDNSYLPSILITDLKIFDSAAQLKRSFNASFLSKVVEVPYKENFLYFEFAALNYTHPEKNHYKYKLDGVDNDWIDSQTQHNANYTNLAAGEYTFKVIASNNTGLWNEKAASIKIKIYPPWWQTIWAYIIYLLGGGGIFLGLVNLQVRRIKQKAAQAIEKEREQAKFKEALLRAETAELQAKAAEAQAKVIEEENKRKSQELNYARQLQLSLLPKQNLSLEKVEIFGQMRTTTEVGGDYYDFIKIDDSHYCLAIGDATGHGVGAGLVVGMIKSLLINSVNSLGDLSTTPSLTKSIHLVNDFNTSLKSSLTQRGIGICLSIGLLDLDSMTVDISSSGMPSLVFYKASTSSIESIDMPGPPLGFMKKIKLKSRELNLLPGDILFFISDGFHERKNKEGKIWGYSSVKNCLQEICQNNLSANQLAQALIDACDKFAENYPNNDDMALLILKIKP